MSFGIANNIKGKVRVLRESVVESGVYETVNDIDNFYLKVTEEINAAIKDGKLEKQATMPSSLMPPWRKGNLGKLFAALGEEVGFILNYDDVEVKVEESVIDSKFQVYEDFKNITRNNAISPIKEIQISGWFACIDTEDVVLEVQDENGNTLHVFAMLKEDKILKEYINNRFGINHSGKMNYSAKFETPRDSKRFFVVAKNNDEILIKKEIENKTVNLEENNCLLEIKKLVVLDKEIEELEFYDIAISLKASSLDLCIEAYEKASKEFNYPLHLGITEAGTEFSGTVKSSIGLGTLLRQGIGDTLR